MSEFWKRALTGSVYVALTLGAAWAGPVTTLLLFLPVCMLAARELHRLYWHGTPNEASIAGPLLSAGVFYLAVALVAVLPTWSPWLVPAVGLLLFGLGISVALIRGDSDPARVCGSLILQLAYIALPFGLVTHVLHGGPEVFIGFMLLLWTNDTGAYLVGRAIGRTKLMPHVSPNKTIEGLAGGIALALVVAWAIARCWPVMPAAHWMICGAVVAVSSTLGDLLESALKRAAGVKDSGHVLPGHGGILDRFDGFLLAAPAMLVCVRLLDPA